MFIMKIKRKDQQPSVDQAVDVAEKVSKTMFGTGPSVVVGPGVG